ncbi:hypothetical protein DL95DRAFT_415253 [Leptodontidium sp. 2 PMI_412]|nr:hypothetical protein DL95DRAFT_415253 [Leptodontidium sp. 2 PMI_412]
MPPQAPNRGVHISKHPENVDRHQDDDEDDDDDEIQVLIKDENGRGEFQSLDTWKRVIPTLEVHRHLRTAEINDNQTRIHNSVMGSHGIRPSNAPPKTLVSLWLVEGTGKPMATGIPLKVLLELSTPLQDKSDVHSFIGNALSDNKFPDFDNHPLVLSGELHLDSRCLHYIAYVDVKEEESDSSIKEERDVFDDDEENGFDIKEEEEEIEVEEVDVKAEKGGLVAVVVEESTIMKKEKKGKGKKKVKVKEVKKVKEDEEYITGDRGSDDKDELPDLSAIPPLIRSSGRVVKKPSKLDF